MGFLDRLINLTPPPRINTDERTTNNNQPSVLRNPDADNGAASRTGEFNMFGDMQRYRLFQLDVVPPPVLPLNAPPLRSLPEIQSTLDGTADGRRVNDALALGERNAFEKFFSSTDASQELGTVMNDVSRRANDPAYASALLREIGPENAARLTGMLREDGDFSQVPRQLLSAATTRGGLSADFQRDLANRMDLSALAHVTGDTANAPLSADFLTAAGQRAVRQDVGWERHDINTRGGNAVFTTANQDADRVLQNIANANPQAANRLLQDPEFVKNALTYTTVLRDGSEGYNRVSGREDFGVAALIRRGTASPPNSEADVETALNSIGGVLQNPQTFANQWGLEGSILGDRRPNEGDPMLTNNVAGALAETFQNNSASYSRGATREYSGRVSFDRDDVRTVMNAVLQHPEQRTRMTLTVQAEAARLFVEGSRYDAPDGQRQASSARAGNLLGVYADAYVGTVLGEAASQDKRAAMVAALTSGAIQAIPNFASYANPLVGGTAATTANLVAAFVQDRMQGNAVDDAQRALSQTGQRSQGLLEASVLTAYHSNARRDADTNPAAQRFVDAVRQYNESLPPQERILNQNGSLRDISQLDPNRSPDAQIISNLNELVTPTGAAPLEVVRQISSMLLEVRSAADINRVR